MTIKANPRRPTTPTLREGMRLRQPAFHRLYQNYPDDAKFELVDGIVHMASPTSAEHGSGTFGLTGVLFYYSARTLGVAGGDNMTTILGWDAEPQPDGLLRLLPECGGQSHFNEERFLIGAPELVAEVAVTSVRLDLGKKLDMYERYGVEEYIVCDMPAHELHWYQFPKRSKILADAQGVFKSRRFPGLWIDGTALFAGDAAALFAAIEKGTKSAGHRKFVTHLKSSQRRSSS